MQYELFYLVGERQEANLETIKGGVNAILALEEATMVGEELSEKRKLAYEIKHQNKGTYITRRFELPEIDFWADEKNGEREFGIAAITNKLNLNNDVLRFLIVKTQDLPELGAKDRRKALEMAAGRTMTPQRPQQQQRPQQRQDNQRQNSRPAQHAPRPATPIMAKIATVAIKPTTTIANKPAKDTGKDIDKQLDALLDK